MTAHATSQLTQLLIALNRGERPKATHEVTDTKAMHGEKEAARAFITTLFAAVACQKEEDEEMENEEDEKDGCSRS